MNTLRTVLLLVYALLEGLFLLPQANAQQHKWQITTGIDVTASVQIWVDADTLVFGSPILQFSYEKWSFFGDAIVSYALISQESLTMNVGFDYREEGFGASVFSKKSSSDNAVFDGYETPDGELTGNVNIGWKALSLSVAHDLSDTSNGTVVELGFGVPLIEVSNQFSLSATASVEWISDHYAQHIYGIEGIQIDETAGRFAFQAEALTNYSISLQAEYVLTKNWIITAAARYMEMDEHVIESPLVSDNKVSEFHIAASYTF